MAEDAVIRALRSVREVRLRLLDLAWEVVDKKGKVDPQKVAFRAQEIKDAEAEAAHYRDATQRAVWALKRLLQP